MTGQDPDQTPGLTEREQRKRIARQFIEAIPHAKALGMVLDDIGPEGAHCRGIPIWSAIRAAG
jgi:hypothetical protein